MIDILLGAALGLVSGSLGAFILYKTVKLLGPGENSPRDTMLTIFGFLVKWPLIFALGYVAYLKSNLALYSFATCIIVVYFATVWRALRVRLF